MDGLFKYPTLTQVMPLAFQKIAVSSTRARFTAATRRCLFCLALASPLSSGDAEDMLGPRFPGNIGRIYCLRSPVRSTPRLILFANTHLFSFIVCSSHIIAIMAGEVRQPIDIPSLERYIDQNVSEIKTPLDIKQASLIQLLV